MSFNNVQKHTKVFLYGEFTKTFFKKIPKSWKTQKIEVHKDINYLSNKASEIRKNAYILYSIVQK